MNSTEEEISLEVQIDKWTDSLLDTLEKSWNGTVLTMESDSPLKANDRVLRSEIESTVRAKIGNFDEQTGATALTKIGSIVSSFLQSKSVVSSIDRKGLVDLVSLAAESCRNPEELKNLEIRIGFGATPTEKPNARVPAYALAAIQILESLQKNGHPLPNVVLYSASRFVESVNTGDGEKIAKAANDNFRMIRQYIDQFAPELAESFTFDQDRNVEAGEPLHALLGLYSKTLENATSPASITARDKVVGMGTKYGSTPENARRYAAAHAVYSSDAVPGPAESILEKSHPRPKNLIMIGGKPEAIFWRVRETVREGVTVKNGIEYFRNRLEQLSCPLERTGMKQLHDRFVECTEEGEDDYMRAQLISQAGEMPVYGMYKGDWSVEDMATRSFEELLAAPFDLRMKRDLLAVLCDIAGVPAEKAYAVTAKRPLEANTKEQLAVAYAQYAELCRNFLKA